MVTTTTSRQFVLTWRVLYHRQIVNIILKKVARLTNDVITSSESLREMNTKYP